LIIPARVIGIAHIISPRGDVGFFAKWNWSLMYVLVLPLLLMVAGSACKAVQEAICQLINPKRAVIYDEHGKVAVGYPEELAGMMEKRSRRVYLTSALLAVLAVAVDTHDLWPGFFTGHFPDSRVPEWDTGFRILCGSQLLKWENFCFDIIAYIFELVYAFLGVFFVLTIWSFLRGIASIFDESQPPYRLKPIVCDLEKRLGLGPLSWVFHWLLVVSICFATYATLHRMEQVDTLRHQRAWTYSIALFSDSKSSTTPAMHGSEHGISLTAIIDLAHKDYALHELLNPSSWVAIVFIALAGGVVCLLPLGRIYQYVKRTKKELLDSNLLAYDTAKKAGDTKTADRLKVQIDCLEEANIWPNGNTVAWTCLILLGGLLAVSIAPPLLPFAISAGAIPGLVSLIKKKKDN